MDAAFFAVDERALPGHARVEWWAGDELTALLWQQVGSDAVGAVWHAGADKSGNNRDQRTGALSAHWFVLEQSDDKMISIKRSLDSASQASEGSKPLTPAGEFCMEPLIPIMALALENIVDGMIHTMAGHFFAAIQKSMKALNDPDIYI